MLSLRMRIFSIESEDQKLEREKIDNMDDASKDKSLNVVFVNESRDYIQGSIDKANDIAIVLWEKESQIKTITYCDDQNSNDIIKEHKMG